MSQVAEYLLCKCEALSSNSDPTKTKQNKTKKHIIQIYHFNHFRMCSSKHEVRSHCLLPTSGIWSSHQKNSVPINNSVLPPALGIRHSNSYSYIFDRCRHLMKKNHLSLCGARINFIIITPVYKLALFSVCRLRNWGSERFNNQHKVTIY
jgi:hypothetical protein